MWALLRIFTFILLLAAGGGHAHAFPDALEGNLTIKAGEPQSIVLAGGCFWGVEAVFKHLKGVLTAHPGYAGGTALTANYEAVSTGSTGHAEAVEVIFDPSQISLGQILKVYFSVAHNPTQLNFQGPDTGPQYRSEIFTTTAEQKRLAAATIKQLTDAKVYSQPIVTKIASLAEFYPAEPYHVDYLAKHPENRYIQIHDKPKLARLKELYPDLYVGN